MRCEDEDGDDEMWKEMEEKRLACARKVQMLSRGVQMDRSVPNAQLYSWSTSKDSQAHHRAINTITR